MSDAAEDDVYVIERILADDEVNGETFYLVKWEGYKDAQCTWEPATSFTSPESIEEYRQQKEAGLSLPEEFLIALQRKMDKFQSRPQQDEGTGEQSSDEEENDSGRADWPNKRQKLAGTSFITQRLPSRTSVLHKKGIAQTVRDSVQKAATSSKSKLAVTAVGKVRVDWPSVERAMPNSYSTSVQKAGQRFRNLSHMNNYRKKAQTEPIPSLHPTKLRSIADFNIGRDDIRMLQPVVISQDRDESPLFIPDTSNFDKREDVLVSSSVKEDSHHCALVSGLKPVKDTNDVSKQRHSLIATEHNTQKLIVQSLREDPQTTRRAWLNRVHPKSPSLEHSVAGLNIEAVEEPTKRLPEGVDFSDQYTEPPRKPPDRNLEAKPLPMTTAPPQSEQSLTRDPRLRHRNLNTEPDEEDIAVASKFPHKLNYKLLITSYPLNPKYKLDHSKARFFISFARSDPAEAKAIHGWLESQRVQASNIYLDSERHDWVRFREKADRTITVLLFNEASLNYNRLPGLGQLLMAEIPTCFSLKFPEKGNIAKRVADVRVKKLFPRMSTYLITESMITRNLEATTSLVKYFDNSKKPGYKIMMRPNIEKWLLEYTANEEDDARRGTLIDLLVLIRSLRPKSDDPVAIDEVEKMHLITGNPRQYPLGISYIISPSRIPGYDEVPASTKPAIPPRGKDDIIKEYFYCYAAVKAEETRRFFAFYTKDEAESHVAAMKTKERENSLDCGHVCFCELEKFVNRFCQRPAPRDVQEEDVVVHNPIKSEETVEETHASPQVQEP